jgi:hypothetical protein
MTRHHRYFEELLDQASGPKFPGHGSHQIASGSPRAPAWGGSLVMAGGHRRGVHEMYPHPARSWRRGADAMTDQEIDPLVRMSCIACRRGEPTVTDAEIARFHPQILTGRSWRLLVFDA